MHFIGPAGVPLSSHPALHRVSRASRCDTIITSCPPPPCRQRAGIPDGARAGGVGAALRRGHFAAARTGAVAGASRAFIIVTGLGGASDY
eukprot:1877113-Pyramimonas_sp.AAC.2